MIEIKNNFPDNYNEHYLNRYISYINHIYNLGYRELQYIEKHHIVPICINSELKNNKDNLIRLTPKEHYIAHLLLSKCYRKHSKYGNKLIFALFAMCKLQMRYHNRNQLSARKYEKLRIAYADAVRYRMKEAIKDKKYDKLKYCDTNRGKISITNGEFNKYINVSDKIPDGWYRGSTQHKDKESFSKALKQSWKNNRQSRVGKNHPMYNKGYLLQGSKNGRYGKKLVYVNNGVINKMIDPKELEVYLKSGYVRGMLRWKHTKPTVNNKGKNNPAYNTKLMNNGIINKRISKIEVDKYLSLGWVLGAKKKIR